MNVLSSPMMVYGLLLIVIALALTCIRQARVLRRLRRGMRVRLQLI